MRSDRLPHEVLAEEVRAQLGRQRMKGVAVALALGVSQAGASRRLSGHTPMDVNDLVRVAELLHMSPCELLAPALVERKSA